MDIINVLKDMQERAGQVVDDLDVDQQVDDAKSAARKIKEKLETDPNAQKAALGGGALLMLLMASRGGRKLVGNVAKTGAVAALGAIAYKAWKERDGQQTAEGLPADVAVAGYVTDTDRNPNFSRALVETMIAAAHADGEIDPQEMELIDAAMKDSGIDLSQIDKNADRDQMLDRIAAAARTPNHAAQLYAAASLATADPSGVETDFLGSLAKKLSIAPDHAARIRAEASQELA